jgi:hypothetical protein
MPKTIIMPKILDFIARETTGECYKSFKYCYDGVAVPSIAYDDRLNEKIFLKEYGEDNHSPNMRDISKKARILIDQPPLFRFFLDGSRRTYKVDDIQYDNKKVYPIIAGQIGVACCERVNRATFKNSALERYMVLSLPEIANADGQNVDLFFNSLADKINSLPKVQKHNIKIDKILPYSTKIDANETLENKGIAKIQDEMVNCEKKIVAQLTAKNLLTPDSYLVKDGTLQYKPMKTGDFKEITKIRNNYRCVIGVSKSFNPELMKDKTGRSNAGIIAHLNLFERTPAFMYAPGEQFGDVRFAVWYVRIHEAKYTETPFSGILKIEKMLMTGSESENGLATEEVDLITANIINERNPVCYGVDNRWGNHLYPIYLTEKYCKSKYISDLHFLNLF